MKKIWEFIQPALYPILAIIVGVIVGLITKSTFVGFIVVLCLFGALILYTWGRQIWWWIKAAIDKRKDDEN